ncbi:PIN domain-containing protein [Ruminococcus sp. HUN007]|uniref:PIN domain-containing protein n=1 Tax=Ruminococcus sp. HUN007 TaxID=1514668 RepID=UPI00067964AE|nr:PIN domain-containing protein [Ruminococcus sp. HUN007]
METYYLIDFENVSTGGFSGCELLGSSDHIHVFFTDKSTKFDLNILHRHRAASLEIHKVPCGNQSADMHIVSYLGYLVGKNSGKNFECIIVSKDTDFDNIIRFWTEAENVSVKRTPVIKSAPVSTEKKNKKQTHDKKEKKADVSGSVNNRKNR